MTRCAEGSSLSDDGGETCELNWLTEFTRTGGDA